MSSISGSGAQQAMIRQILYESAHPIAPAFCESHPKPDLVRLSKKSRQRDGSGQTFAHVFASNWGGTGITEAENGAGINGVYGAFTVGRDLTTSGPGAEATWLGLGGGLDSEGPPAGLIQDGISMQAGEGYQSWFELVNYNSSGDYTCCSAHYTTTPGNAGPGDSITSQVWWDSSTEACFYLSDAQHSGADIPSTCDNVSGTITYDHTSAEWVNESINGETTEKNPNQTYLFYDNPGTINWTAQLFTDSFGGGGTWQSPFGAGESIIMYYTLNPPSGTSCGTAGVLSYPDDIGSNSFGGYSSIVTCEITGVDSP
jgi:hypothetical protein